MHLIIYLPISEKKIILTVVNTLKGQDNRDPLVQIKTDFINISKENDRLAAVISPALPGKESVITELFKYKSIYSFYMNFGYDVAYPFSLIAYEDNTLFELAWDGSRHTLKNLLANKAQFWQIEEGRVMRKEFGNGLSDLIGTLAGSDPETIGKIHGEIGKQIKSRVITGIDTETPVCFISVIKDIAGIRMLFEDKSKSILNELTI